MNLNKETRWISLSSRTGNAELSTVSTHCAMFTCMLKSIAKEYVMAQFIWITT